MHTINTLEMIPMFCSMIAIWKATLSNYFINMLQGETFAGEIFMFSCFLAIFTKLNPRKKSWEANSQKIFPGEMFENYVFLKKGQKF